MTEFVEQNGNDTALVSPNSYYRSKISTVTHGINPLVAAASPIFSIINQCLNHQRIADLEQLQRELVHEITSFESNLQNQDIPQKTIMAARYALCSFADETITQHLGDNHTDWRPYLILKRFHNNEWGGQQFFALLERSISDTANYIDLLELFYLCLALGYQGKYRNNEQGYIIRENIMGKLYECIRNHRGDVSKNMLVGSKEQGTCTTPIKKKRFGVIALSIAALLPVYALITGAYHTFDSSNATLQRSMTTMLQSQTHHKDSHDVY